ncbi:MAG: transcriptional regulator, Crp/Fnr family [Flavipsychrobacter sp.]|jgi:CRP-like cAMP-binding protein|nr:transcriptional regulator, Crp/Fnr family [Flavipsychrobacter sp.]
MSLTGIFPIDKWDYNSRSILTDIKSGDYENLFRHSVEEKYARGEVIFREKAEPNGIFYIKSGMVKKYKVDNFGKEKIFYVANIGELIGYHALLSAERYPDSAAALEESMICFIPKEDFLNALDQSPGLSKMLLKTLSHEFGVLANNISVLAQRSVRERLAIALIVLREKYKKNVKEGQPISINLSRDDISSMVGTTRENVVRILRDFKDEQLIETKGRKIWITDVNKMAAISTYK